MRNTFGRLEKVSVKHYEDFTRTGESFAAISGEPEETDAAIGQIALGFSFLEDTARNVVIMLAGTDSRVGHILTTELSFRQKLTVISALAVELIDHGVSEAEREAVREEVLELIGICRKAEELRNTYLHSSYVGPASRIGQARAKVSAKGQHGLRVRVEAVDADLLADVATYITYTAMELELLPAILGLADFSTGGADFVSYTKDDRIIATFRFGDCDGTSELAEQAVQPDNAPRSA